MLNPIYTNGGIPVRRRFVLAMAVDKRLRVLKGEF